MANVPDNKVYLIGIPNEGGLWINRHRCYQSYQAAKMAAEEAREAYAGAVVIWMLRVEDAVPDVVLEEA